MGRIAKVGLGAKVRADGKPHVVRPQRGKGNYHKRKEGAKRGGKRNPPGGHHSHKPNSRAERAKSFVERYPTLPLEHLMNTINDEKASLKRRDNAAVHAAPYLHRRLGSLQVSGPNGGPVEHNYSFDLSKLTDDELIIFERLMAKIQMPATVDDDKLLEYDPLTGTTS